MHRGSVGHELCKKFLDEQPSGAFSLAMDGRQFVMLPSDCRCDAHLMCGVLCVWALWFGLVRWVGGHGCCLLAQVCKLVKSLTLGTAVALKMTTEINLLKG